MLIINYIHLSTYLESLARILYHKISSSTDIFLYSSPSIIVESYKLECFRVRYSSTNFKRRIIMKPTFLSRFADVLTVILFIAIFTTLVAVIYYPIIGYASLICLVYLGELIQRKRKTNKEEAYNKE